MIEILKEVLKLVGAGVLKLLINNEGEPRL